MGIDVRQIGIQTDNDGAFVGNWRPGSFSSFTYVIEAICEALHLSVPPAAPTYNSDVETVHVRVEEELFDIEEIYDAYDLRCEAWSYVIYFILIRLNSNKNYKTPLKIIAEELEVIDPQLLALPPIILDDNFHIYLNTINNEDSLKESHHVPRLLTSVDNLTPILQNPPHDAHNPIIRWVSRQSENVLFSSKVKMSAFKHKPSSFLK